MGLVELNGSNTALDKMKNIVVVGAGAAGYFTAAALKRNIPNVNVTILYDPAVPMIGVGEALSWGAPAFMKKVLGLDDEEAWIKESESTYKFGLRVCGFDGIDTPYFLGGGMPPPAANKLLLDTEYDLFDLWMHLNAKDRLSELKIQPPKNPFNVYASESYWFNQFNTVPQRYTSDRLLADQSLYSYHVNAKNIGRVVHDRVGKPAGVIEIPIKVRDVVLNKDGSIDYLLLDDETKQYADLFIDCTGFSRILVNKIPSFTFNEMDEYSNDTAIVGPYAYQDRSEVVNYTTANAMDHGWHFSVPSVYRSGEGYIFNSRVTSDVDMLIDEYYKKTNKKSVDFKKISWTPGYYDKTFSGNCMLLGLSAGFVDPFDSNGFNTVLEQIRSIIRHLTPDTNFQFGWRDHFNKRCSERITDIQLRIQGFMELAPKNNTEYWQRLKIAAKKHDVENELLKLFFDPARNPTSKLFVSNIGQAYNREGICHNILYYNLPAEFKTIDIDQFVEDMGLQFFNFNSLRNQERARTAMPCADYYKQLFPDLK